MNIDRACYLIIASLLPLLFLPEFLLWVGVGWAVVLLLVGLWHKSWLYGFCAVCIALSYGRVIGFAENAAKQTAYVSTERITVHQILREGEYRTAIAERQNGDKIYLVWQSETPLQPRHYQAELKLRPIASRLNSGNFNRQRWLLAQNIVATASVKKAEPVPDTPLNFRTQWLERTLEQTDDLVSQGLILALAFGERAWLLPEHWQIFQQTATAHLIAISGLHIALAFGVGFGATKIVLRLSGKKGIQAVRNPHFFAIGIGFLVAWGYSFLAGFSLPTLRAILAISFVLLCRISRRHFTAWQFWWRVVCLLILIEPKSLLSDSFWLSVLAVASLIFWYQRFPLKEFPYLNEWQKQAKWRAFCVSLFHLQLGITLCFLPVQFYFFEGSSLYAFPANLLIVPLYSLAVVPLILFTLLTDNWLHTWLLIDWLILQSLVFLTPLAGAWKVLNWAEQWQILTLDLAALVLLYYRQQLRTHFSTIIVAVAAFHQLYFLPTKWRERAAIEWLHFDVGQGLAMAFIYHENGEKRAVLYDTGASWVGGSMAELEIIPYLKRHGITLDTLILSHDDNDHVGGAEPILTAFPSTKVILSTKSRYTAHAFSPCTTGKQWQFGKLHFTAIYPPQLVERAENEHSCVLLATIGKFRLLLTGDSGTKQERDFSSRVGKVDFLQVGHHGSKTSTSYTLLANTRPHTAFISASRFNPWKMPSLSVTSRLDELGVKWLNTARHGMVRVKFYPERYEIQAERDGWQPWYSGYFGQ